MLHSTPQNSCARRRTCMHTSVLSYDGSRRAVRRRKEGRAEEGRQEGCGEEGGACEEGRAQEGREEGREEGRGEEGRGEEGAAGEEGRGGEEARGEEGRAQGRGQGRAEHHQQALRHALHRWRQGRHARPGVRLVGSERIVAHVEQHVQSGAWVAPKLASPARPLGPWVWAALHARSGGVCHSLPVFQPGRGRHRISLTVRLFNV
eukprot:scaffold39923_cov64-Phaeocystis_antarctica.AAC.6